MVDERTKELAELRSSEFDRTAWVIDDNGGVKVTVYLDQVTDDNKIGSVNDKGWVWYRDMRD